MEPPSRYSVAIVNRSGVRSPTALIRAGVRAALLQAGAPSARVSILLTEDAEIRELNRTYRKLDEATDVLSFPAGDAAWLGADRDFLGDVAISVSYARRQATQRGVRLQVELCYLAIHGTLHLLGLDDETEPGRLQMLHAMNLAGSSIGLARDPDWGSIHFAAGATA